MLKFIYWILLVISLRYIFIDILLKIYFHLVIWISIFGLVIYQLIKYDKDKNK
jgi:hypothetical protein